MSEGFSRRTALTVGLAVPALAACGEDATDTPNAGGSSPAGGASTPTSSAPDGGIASTADIPVGGGAVFGDEGVVVTQPTAGEFKGFSSVCTHQGCTLASVTDTINCSCHGSQFAIADGANVTGPSGSPGGSVDDLPTVEIRVEGDQIFMS